MTTPILHVSQLAAALGLSAPQAGGAARFARETLPVLRSWLGHLRGLDPSLLTKPTRSRNRSLRNLTVNVFHPFELLPAAWRTGEFPWEPERDDERETLVETPGEVTAYAERILEDWAAFVGENAEELDRVDPSVVSPRGEVRFSTLVESQLEHARFHLEQLVAFLQAEGRPAG